VAVRRLELDRYLRASKKLDLTGIDFDRVPEHPLSSAEIRCLTYMMDIEAHTVIYLRDLLSTTQRLVRWALGAFWTPVGTGVRPLEETDFVVCRLFGDDDGLKAVGEMEREMSKLPGLSGMRLMRRARSRALQRAGVTKRRARLPIAALSA
jgi:hypothetical protein